MNGARVAPVGTIDGVRLGWKAIKRAFAENSLTLLSWEGSLTARFSSKESAVSLIVHGCKPGSGRAFSPSD